MTRVTSTSDRSQLDQTSLVLDLFEPKTSCAFTNWLREVFANLSNISQSVNEPPKGQGQKTVPLCLPPENQRRILRSRTHLFAQRFAQMIGRLG